MKRRRLLVTYRLTRDELKDNVQALVETLRGACHCTMERCVGCGYWGVASEVVWSTTHRCAGECGGRFCDMCAAEHEEEEKAEEWVCAECATQEEGNTT